MAKCSASQCQDVEGRQNGKLLITSMFDRDRRPRERMGQVPSVMAKKNHENCNRKSVMVLVVQRGR